VVLRFSTSISIPNGPCSSRDMGMSMRLYQTESLLNVLLRLYHRIFA
jgi:hypothetical protein